MNNSQKMMLMVLFVFVLATSWGWNLRSLSSNPGIAVSKWVFQTTTGLAKLAKGG